MSRPTYLAGPLAELRAARRQVELDLDALEAHCECLLAAGTELRPAQLRAAIEALGPLLAAPLAPPGLPAALAALRLAAISDLAQEDGAAQREREHQAAAQRHEERHARFLAAQQQEAALKERCAAGDPEALAAWERREKAQAFARREGVAIHVPRE
jgi:hypothetical protein